MLERARSGGVLILALLLVTSVVLPVGIGAGAESLSVSVDAPAETTVGDATSIAVTVTVPDVTGTYTDRDLTITVAVDGEQIATRTVTVSDGTTVSVNVTHTFETTGTHTVSAEASVTLGLTTYTGSGSRDVSVIEGPDRVSVSGTSFSVPPSLEDEVDQLRSNLSLDRSIPSNVFVLANESDVYVVFTSAAPETGVASVDGIRGNVTRGYRNLTVGAIVANRTTFRTDGRDVALDRLVSNPGAYSLDLVETGGHFARVTTLTDPDTTPEVTLAESAGLLSETPPTADPTVAELATGAGRATLGASNGTDSDSSTGLRSRLDTLTNTSRPLGATLPTFSFRTAYWTAANATLDGVLLTPGSAARRFARAVDDPNVSAIPSSQPVLYVTNVSFNATRLSSVGNVTNRSEQLDGDVVRLEARSFRGLISVQETLEHATSCTVDRFPVQTSSGTACINIVQDVLLEGDAFWSTVPTDQSDVLIAAGASSRELDEPTDVRRGRYVVTGEVVDSNRIDPSLPDGTALVVYDLERTGSIDWSAVRSEAKDVIRNASRRVVDALRNGVNRSTARLENRTNDSVGPEQITLTGTSFSVPPSLEDEVDRLRSNLSVPDPLPSRAFVLANESSIYLVFTSTAPKTGIATVEGISLDATADYRNLTLGAVVANRTTFRTDGRDVPLADLVANPDAYSLDLVETGGHFARVTTLTDPDTTPEVTLAESAGLLSETPPTADPPVAELATGAGGYVVNASNVTEAGLRGRLEEITNTSRPLGATLPTFSFRTAYWTAANATLDGILLTPGSAAQRFARAVDDPNVSATPESQPVLYVTNVSFNATRVSSVSDVTTSGDQLDGEVIRLDARAFRGLVSVQETLEHATSCTVDRFPVQTSSGTTCINIVQDVLLEGDAFWSTVPTSRSEVLVAAGASSRELDEPTDIRRGRYVVTGEVVDTSRIDPALPNGTALVVYDLERTGSIDWSAVRAEAKAIIRNASQRVVGRLQNAVNRSTDRLENRTGTNDSIGPAQVTVTGTSFSVPPSLEDEVDRLRSNVSLPDPLPSRAFVLANESSVSLVLTSASPETGIATVEGQRLPGETVSYRGLSLGVVVADTTTFQTDGTDVPLGELVANASEYELALVETAGHFKRVTTLTDPDTTPEITLAESAGVLSERPPATDRIVEAVSGDAVNYTRDTTVADDGTLRARLDTLTNTSRPLGAALPTFSFQTAYWAGSNATLDGVLLVPGTAAQRFAQAVDSENVSAVPDGQPVLYVTNVSFDATRVSSVSAVTTSSGKLDGDVVRLEARAVRQLVSVQETLEHATNCTVDRFPVQTSSGTACVNIVQDVLLEGDVFWSTVPTDRSGVLGAVGASSRELDMPSATRRGRYRVTGEVVDSSRLDPTLPNGTVLVVYALERTGSIDYDAIGDGAKTIIENGSESLARGLRDRVNRSTARLDNRTDGGGEQPPADVPDVAGNGQPATDTDGDGRYEDVDGDGSFDIIDVSVLLNNFDKPAVSGASRLFDFNDDGQINILDVAALLSET